MAGVIYNVWMVRTKSPGDCILAHAITNACLSAYVIAGGHWQYGQQQRRWAAIRDRGDAKGAVVTWFRWMSFQGRDLPEGDFRP